MGQRGPQPLPANVHALRGNASKKPIAQLLGEFQPEVEIPDSPTWLWPGAKKEWKRLTPELHRYGLISKLDRGALVRACQAWAKYEWAERMLAREMKIAAAKREAFDEAEEKLLAAAVARGENYQVKVWSGGDGFQVPTPNGSLTYSAYWVAAKHAGAEYDKLCASFGLSPSSRARVQQSEQYPWLPGMSPTGTPEGAGETAPPKKTLSDFGAPPAAQ